MDGFSCCCCFWPKRQVDTLMLSVILAENSLGTAAIAVSSSIGVVALILLLVGLLSMTLKKWRHEIRMGEFWTFTTKAEGKEMKVWHGVVIAVVSLVLQACLLAAVNYLLSRHMAKENERILKKARLQVPRPSPAHYCPPAAKEMKETRAERSTPVPEPRYLREYRGRGRTCLKAYSALSGLRGSLPAAALKKNSFYFTLDDSDTSSDSSDSSDGSPPTHQATKDVNYTQVVFSAPGGQRNDSVLDYENVEEATDYINVKPKSHKPSFWTFVNPGVFEPVEYPSGHVNSRLFNGV
eukprot:bmy_02375T0